MRIRLDGDLIKNLLNTYSANLLNGLLGLLVVPICVRVFGLDGYGLFSTSSVIFGYISLIDLGMFKNLTRLHASQQEGNKTKIQAMIAFYYVIGTLVLLSLPGILWVSQNVLFPVPLQYRKSLKVIVLLAVIEYLATIPVNICMSKVIGGQEFKKNSIFISISGIVRYVLLISATLAFRDPVIVLSFYTLRKILDIVLAIRLSGITLNDFAPKLDFSTVVDCLRHTVGLSFAQTLQILLLGIGSTLVNSFFGIESLGRYRSALDIVTKVWFVSNSLGLVLFPKFVSSASRGEKEGRFSLRILNVSLLVYLILASVGCAVMPIFFRWLVLNESASLQMISLLLISICLNAHANLSYEYLQANERYFSLVLIIALALSLLIGVFVFSAIWLGAIAIALAWFISQLFYVQFIDFTSIGMSFKRDGWCLVERMAIILGFVSLFLVSLTTKASLAAGILSCISILCLIINIKSIKKKII